MDDVVVSFPGTTYAETASGVPRYAETASGVPRHDMAAMLRGLADRAEAGELDALVLAASMTKGGMITAVSTPENAYYSMLGACHELQAAIRKRAADLAKPSERTY